jgi:cation diffusion facilitator CzcD-associated flavoprotein CzcO
MPDRFPPSFLIPFILSGVSACTADDTPETFRGQAFHAGADPDAVVLTIDDERFPSILLTQENGAVNLGVFQHATGSPALTIRDANNDGVFDLLTYSALSESGETLVDVEDYGMDGQPDFILNHQVPSASVFYRGRWHVVDGVGTESVTVLVDGGRVSLKEILKELGRPE